MKKNGRTRLEMYESALTYTHTHNTLIIIHIHTQNHSHWHSHILSLSLCHTHTHNHTHPQMPEEHCFECRWVFSMKPSPLSPSPWTEEKLVGRPLVLEIVCRENLPITREDGWNRMWWLWFVVSSSRGIRSPQRSFRVLERRETRFEKSPDSSLCKEGFEKTWFQVKGTMFVTRDTVFDSDVCIKMEPNDLWRAAASSNELKKSGDSSNSHTKQKIRVPLVWKRRIVLRLKFSTDTREINISVVNVNRTNRSWSEVSIWGLIWETGTESPYRYVVLLRRKPRENIENDVPPQQCGEFEFTVRETSSSICSWFSFERWWWWWW